MNHTTSRTNRSGCKRTDLGDQHRITKFQATKIFALTMTCLVKNYRYVRDQKKYVA